MPPIFLGVVALVQVAQTQVVVLVLLALEAPELLF
jgi:hypothetical protein